MQNSHRPRRNRRTPAIRGLVAETRLHPGHFVMPLFIKEGISQEPIPSMPGIHRLGEDALYKEIDACLAVGVHSFVLFPAIPDKDKNAQASEATNPDGFYPRQLRALRERFPDIVIITDIALDPYNADGHDGLVKEGRILNDETVEVLAKMAVLHAQAGADFVGPSDMMDGRVAAIRSALDMAGFLDTGIISYAAKYASAFYGPFRDALSSAPKAGDKKTYQMDPANRREAQYEAWLDEEQGADMLMVKPALPYLDIISDLAADRRLPIAAYQVSGEYAMIKAAAQNGWIDNDNAMLESLTSIRRAGADVILTYFAKEAATLLAKNPF